MPNWTDFCAFSNKIHLAGVKDTIKFTFEHKMFMEKWKNMKKWKQYHQIKCDRYQIVKNLLAH